jgi:hypothetical protein
MYPRCLAPSFLRKVFVYGLVSILVFTNLFLIDSSAQNAAAEDQAIDSLVTTHFYKLNKSILEIPGGATFITKSLDGKSLFTLGILQADNFKTSQNAVYPLSQLYSENLQINSLKELDLRKFALSGSRILDFEFIGDNKFEFNAIVSLSRNHGGGFFLCRDMIVLGIKISTDPNVEHKIVRKIFETGCVPSNIQAPGVLWNVLEQSGGALGYRKVSSGQGAPNLELYVTIGDFKLLSQNRHLLNQKGINSGQVLGSIIKIKVSESKLNSSNIELPTLSASVISAYCARGIRNSQGLSFIQDNGKNLIAATSHGPRGGDTLMFFDCSKTIDYGWPNFSLGTSYSGKTTDLGNNVRDEGTVASTGIPNWTWAPSIGPSSIIQISGKGKFSKWWTNSKNKTQDLLVSGMAAKKLIRLRSYQGKVIGIEDIAIGERCRSLIEMTSGSLICGLDSNKILVLKYNSEWNSSNGGFSS